MHQRRDIREPLRRLRILWMLVVVLVSTLPVGMHILFAAINARSEMAIVAQVKAGLVEQVVAAQPVYWIFEDYRLNHLLGIGRGGVPERIEVRDNSGTLAIIEGERGPGPVLAVSVPIRDSGLAVGHLSIERGLGYLMPQLAMTLGVSFLLALGVFILAVRGPLAAVDGMADDLRREKEAEASLRRAAEEQLAQARKLEAMGTLASGMAHSLNNMLTPITLLADMLREKTAEGSRERDILDRISQGAERASHLIASVLAFSRRGEPRTVRLPASQVVDEVVGMVRDVLPRGIEMELTVAEEAGWVAVDPPQIQAALLNLVGNALDAMRGLGGTVAITLVREHLEGGSLSRAWNLAPGTYAEIRIADTGTGMAPEVAERVFEPFFTTKEVGKGTGLGLSSTYGIVRAHHGAVTLDSRFGVGTTFTVYLPNVESPERLAAPAAPGYTGGERGGD